MSRLQLGQTDLIKLVPMTESQYQVFIKISTADQVQNQIKSGLMTPDGAAAAIATQQKRMLPEGLATPNHFFFAIETAADGEKVGDLWFTTMKRGGKEQGFVMDIQVDPSYRRRGYGRSALRAIEDFARQRGLAEMGLSVFGHNAPARSLYQQLGYREIGITMSKDLLASVSAEERTPE